jgi:AraC-like DNA-binding protein
MSSFFSIRPLTELETTGTDDIREETIEMFFVLNGEVVIQDKKFHVLLDNNNLYCANRNRYCKVSINQGAEGYIIRFNQTLLYNGDGEFNCSWFPAFQTLVLTGKVIQVEDAFLKEGKKLCEMMLQEFEHDNDFKLQMLSAFLNIFLFHLMRKLDSVMYNTDKAGRVTLVRRFNLLLEQRFKTSKKVSDYASLLSVSPNYLNETIKQATGKSVGALIRQRVVMEAVRQARLTGASMKEVAYDLGFSDNAHFSKFFKKAAGRNFTEIRKYLFDKTIVSFKQGIT